MLPASLRDITGQRDVPIGEVVLEANGKFLDPTRLYEAMLSILVRILS